MFTGIIWVIGNWFSHCIDSLHIAVQFHTISVAIQAGSVYGVGHLYSELESFQFDTMTRSAHSGCYCWSTLPRARW